MGDQPAETSEARALGEGRLAVDLAFAVVAKATATIGAAARPVQSLGGPLVHAVLRPPLVPSVFQPATWIGRAARRGVVYRSEVRGDVDGLLARVVPAVVSQLLRHVDLNDLVRENLDVVTLAEEVIAEIDLPAIIRNSTGAVASDTLLGVRMQSIAGDEAIRRAMDRLRVRLGRGAADPLSRRAAVSESMLVAPTPRAPPRAT